MEYDPLTALLVAGLVTAVLAVFFWPRLGLVPRWRRERRMTKRVLSEDALKHIYNRELAGRQPSMESIAGALNISLNQQPAFLRKWKRTSWFKSKKAIFT